MHDRLISLIIDNLQIHINVLILALNVKRFEWRVASALPSQKPFSQASHKIMTAVLSLHKARQRHKMKDDLREYTNHEVFIFKYSETRRN